MIARKVKGLHELEICLGISRDTSLEFAIPEFSYSLKAARDSIWNLQRSHFFRVIEYNSEIIGWIAASVGQPARYSDILALQLDFYHCTLKGYSAVTALRVAHESLYLAAQMTRGVTVAVTSPCPHTPLCFNRVLTKEGWKDYGHILVKIC